MSPSLEYTSPCLAYGYLGVMESISNLCEKSEDLKPGLSKNQRDLYWDKRKKNGFLHGQRIAGSNSPGVDYVISARLFGDSSSSIQMLQVPNMSVLLREASLALLTEMTLCADVNSVFG